MTTTTPRRPRRRTPARQTGEHLADHTDAQGRLREIITLAGVRGSRLVIDRIASTHGDQRLIAHLRADEPPENAAIVCALYLGEGGQRPCRRLRARDIQVDPAAEDLEPAADDSEEPQDGVLAGSAGSVYRLSAALDSASLPQLRWHCHSPGGSACAELLTLRQLTGSLQSYRPALGLSEKAIRVHELDAALSVTVLRAELRRLRESPIVLNRGLREAVLAAIEKDRVSMSEIAIRCGRRKRDQRGCESGETSWLGRRIGILPESGQHEPTPWVHSDVLALIARAGLGVAPHEVELI